MMCFLCTEALGDMSVCYILDGILILYGIILTVLYCRLRVRQTGTTHAAPCRQGRAVPYGCMSVLQNHNTDENTMIYNNSFAKIFPTH